MNRRFGHNEQDQPRFTQPLIYKNIAQHKATLDYYYERLAHEGLTNEDAFSRMKERIYATLNQAVEASKSYKPIASDWLESNWKDFKSTSVGRWSDLTIRMHWTMCSR